MNISRLSIPVVCILGLIALPAAAQQPKTIGTFDSWEALSFDEGGSLVFKKLNGQAGELPGLDFASLASQATGPPLSDQTVCTECTRQMRKVSGVSLKRGACENGASLL